MLVRQQPAGCWKSDADLSRIVPITASCLLAARVPIITKFTKISAGFSLQKRREFLVLSGLRTPEYLQLLHLLLVYSRYSSRSTSYVELL
jgi:hypothetical protein